jgi:hypothetical protein
MRAALWNTDFSNLLLEANDAYCFSGSGILPLATSGALAKKAR